MHILIILLGITCILISLYLVVNINDKESKIYSDILSKHKDIVEYSNVLDDIVNNLENILENRLDHNINDIENKKINSIDNNKENNEVEIKIIEKSNIIENYDNEIDVKESDIENKVYLLYKDGLSSHEIARKLKKGIREVDIIIKLIKMKENNKIKQ